MAKKNPMNILIKSIEQFINQENLIDLMKKNKFTKCTYKKLIWWNSCYTFRLENLMIKKLFTLFKLSRKLAKSDILKIASKFHKPPTIIKILFQILSFSFSKNDKDDFNTTEGERLSKSLAINGYYLY